MYIYDSSRNIWVPLRATNQYKKKRKLVRDAWIVLGLIMLGLPAAVVLALSILATFISFAVLDESTYRFK